MITRSKKRKMDGSDDNTPDSKKQSSSKLPVPPAVIDSEDLDEDLDGESSQNSQTSQTTDSFSSLCPICYENMIYPIELSCTHTFCYLCVKGAYKENQLCPMCRSPIYKSVINNPKLSTSTKIKYSKEEKSFKNNKIEWFYESDRDKNLWWRFDIKTSMEIEGFYEKFLGDDKIENVEARNVPWYTKEKQDEMLRKCGKCKLCFGCLVALPPKMDVVKRQDKNFTKNKYSNLLKQTIDCINNMILDNALHLGVHLPHGYPSAAGNRRACRDYRPLSNYVDGDSKNPKVYISGSVYVIDFVEKIQYAENGLGRPRLVRRMDELDLSIDKIRGTAGIKE